MKQIVLLCFWLILVGTLRVQCRKVKPDEHQSTSRPPKTGWRKGDGVCVCNKGPIPTSHAGSHLTGYPIHHPTGSPSQHLTRHHSHRFSGHPSHHPTGYPSPHPTGHPGHHPSGNPGHHRTGYPGHHQTRYPDHHPTGFPSPRPSGDPSHHRTGYPSPSPSGHPSHRPSGNPDHHPTGYPSPRPSGDPSHHPRGYPGPRPSDHTSHQPSRHHGHHPSGQPSHHPSGYPSHHQSGHHGHHPLGHPTPRPSGHHGRHPSGQPSHHPSGHTSYHPSRHHGHHPSEHPTPRPSGHHGHHPSEHPSPRASGHPSHYPSRHHGQHPSEHPSSDPPGHHGHHPSRYQGAQPPGNNPHRSNDHPSSKELYTRCECRRIREDLIKLRWRMNMKWNDRLSNKNTEDYKALTLRILNKLKKVFKRPKRFPMIEFTEGSVVVKVGVVFEVFQNGSIGEDPKKALTKAILNGEMKDLGIYTDSLQITQSFYGVQLSEWKSSLHDCIKGCRYPSQKVQRTRTCTEISGSCEGIPLSVNSTCLEACPKHHTQKGRTKEQKVLVIVGICGGLFFMLITIVVLFRIKKSNKKYVSTSPSSTSIQELAMHDEFQFNQKC